MKLRKNILPSKIGSKNRISVRTKCPNRVLQKTSNIPSRTKSVLKSWQRKSQILDRLNVKFLHFTFLKLFLSFFLRRFPGVSNILSIKRSQMKKNVIFDLFSPKRESFYQKGSVVFKPIPPLFPPKTDVCSQVQSIKTSFLRFHTSKASKASKASVSLEKVLQRKRLYNDNRFLQRRNGNMFILKKDVRVSQENRKFWENRNIQKKRKMRSIKKFLIGVLTFQPCGRLCLRVPTLRNKLK